MAPPMRQPLRDLWYIQRMLLTVLPHIGQEEANAAAHAAFENAKRLSRKDLRWFEQRFNITNEEQKARWALLLAFFSMFNVAVVRPNLDEGGDGAAAKLALLQDILADLNTLTGILWIDFYVIHHDCRWYTVDGIPLGDRECVERTIGDKPMILYLPVDEAPNVLSEHFRTLERGRYPMIVVVGDLDAQRDAHCEQQDPGWEEFIHQNSSNRIVRICHHSFSCNRLTAQLEDETSGANYHRMKILFGFVDELISMAYDQEQEQTAAPARPCPDATASTSGVVAQNKPRNPMSLEWILNPQQ